MEVDVQIFERLTFPLENFSGQTGKNRDLSYDNFVRPDAC
jgi:hypothetical protein